MKVCLLLCLFFLAVTGVSAQEREYLYVENSRGGDITVIEIPSHKVVGTIPASKVGHHPDDVIATKSGDTIYVNRLDKRDILAISTATEEVLWRVEVGGTPHHMSLSADERFLYAPIFNDQFLEVIDTGLRKVVARVEVGYGPHGTFLSPDGKRLYVGGLLGHQIAVVEVGTHKVVKKIQFPNGVRPFAISPDEKRLYVQLSRLHGFVVVDLRDDRIAQTVHLPTFGKDIPTSAYAEFPHTVNHGMALTGDGKYLFVAATLSDFVAVYSLPDLDLVATVPVGKEPGWLVLSRDGRFCYASNRKDNSVSVISVSDRKEIARIAVGDYPQRMTTAVVRGRRVADRRGGR